MTSTDYLPEPARQLLCALWIWGYDAPKPRGKASPLEGRVPRYLVRALAHVIGATAMTEAQVLSAWKLLLDARLITQSKNDGRGVLERIEVFGPANDGLGRDHGGWGKIHRASPWRPNRIPTGTWVWRDAHLNVSGPENAAVGDMLRIRVGRKVLFRVKIDRQEPEVWLVGLAKPSLSLFQFGADNIPHIPISAPSQRGRGEEIWVLPTRTGRPRLSNAESRKRLALVQNWNRAREAGTRQKDFCSDNQVTVKRLQRYITWATQRDRRPSDAQ